MLSLVCGNRIPPLPSGSPPPRFTSSFVMDQRNEMAPSGPRSDAGQDGSTRDGRGILDPFGFPLRIQRRLVAVVGFLVEFRRVRIVDKTQSPPVPGAAISAGHINRSANDVPA